MTKPKLHNLLFEIAEYAEVKQLRLTSAEAMNLAEDFLDYYESIGWKVGKKHMVSWRHNIKLWFRKRYKDRIKRNKVTESFREKYMREHGHN